MTRELTRAQRKALQQFLPDTPYLSWRDFCNSAKVATDLMNAQMISSIDCYRITDLGRAALAKETT